MPGGCAARQRRPPAPRRRAAARRRPRRGAAVIEPGNVAPTPRTVDGVDYIEGRDLTLIYEGKKCIHSRFCVTWGPKVFIANVKGPWINPDAMSTEALTEIAHVCVSGAIRYKRKDGQPDEARAAGESHLACAKAGRMRSAPTSGSTARPPASYRYTLCRCGASKNKPFCDGSHHDGQLRRERRAADGQGRHAAGARRPARDRSADRRPAAGARQHGDHQRHRARGRAHGVRAAVPLRRAATPSRSATAATRAWASDPRSGSSGCGTFEDRDHRVRAAPDGRRQHDLRQFPAFDAHLVEHTRRHPSSRPEKFLSCKAAGWSCIRSWSCGSPGVGRSSHARDCPYDKL